MLFRVSSERITAEGSAVRDFMSPQGQTLTHRATRRAAPGEDPGPDRAGVGRVAIAVASELMLIYGPGLSPLGNGMILRAPCVGGTPWNARVRS